MPHSHPSASLPTIFGLLIGLAGCGGGDAGTEVSAPSAEASPPEATTAMPEVEACALVSAAELETIIGAPVKPGEPEATPLQGVTYFSCRSDDVHINVEAWGDPGAAKSSFEFGTKYPPVDGLGHPAKNTQPIGDLDVLVGRYVLSVDLFTRLSLQDELKAATAIARIPIKRLP